MKLKALIRILEAKLGLFVGLYWLFNPNDFSEPLILIVASIAILLEGLFQFRKRDIESVELGNKKAWAIILSVFVMFTVIFLYSIFKTDDSKINDLPKTTQLKEEKSSNTTVEDTIRIISKGNYENGDYKFYYTVNNYNDTTIVKKVKIEKQIPEPIEEPPAQDDPNIITAKWLEGKRYKDVQLNYYYIRFHSPNGNKITLVTDFTTPDISDVFTVEGDQLKSKYGSIFLQNGKRELVGSLDGEGIDFRLR